MTPPRALLFGTIVVGVLDIVDAFVFFGLRSGARPTRILQSVAAGLLGRDAAIAGGLGTAALGLGLHFFNAFVIVATFFLAARLWPALLRHTIVAGLIYGLIVYVVMNYVVVPLSAAGGSIAIPPWPVLVNGVSIHLLGVGLPAALFARLALTSPGR